MKMAKKKKKKKKKCRDLSSLENRRIAPMLTPLTIIFQFWYPMGLCPLNLERKHQTV